MSQQPCQLCTQAVHMGIAMHPFHSESLFMSLQRGIASAQIGALGIDYDFHQPPLVHVVDPELILSMQPNMPQLLLRVTPSTSPASHAPLSVHAQNRALLRQASALMAHILAAITTHAPDVALVTQRIPSLRTDPNTITLQARMQFDANGGPIEEVYEDHWQLHMLVRERSIVHIRHMVLGQRRQLQEGVEFLKTTTLHCDSVLLQIDQAIKESVQREVCSQLLPKLERLLERAAHHQLTKDDANEGFVGLKINAENILDRSGFAALPPPNDAHTLRQILVEGLIGRHIENNAIHQGDASAIQNVVTFFSQLSLSSLGSFFSVRKADPDHGWLALAGHNPFLFAQANISLRISHCNQLLTPLLIALTDQPLDFEAPDLWHRQVKTFSQHLKGAEKLEKFVQYYLPSMAMPFDAMRQEITLVLNEARYHQNQRLRQLPANHLQALQRLAKATRNHNVHRFLEKVIALQPLEKLYVPLLSRGFARAVEGDLLGLFQHLTAANSLAQKTLRSQHIRKLYANPTDIFYDLYQQPIALLQDDDLLKLHAILYDNRTLQVLDDIATTGQSILNRHGRFHVIDSHKVKQCADASHEFALLQQGTANALHVRKLSPLPMRVRIPLPSASKILEHSFGIHVGAETPDGYATTHKDASPAMQTQWHDTVAKFVAIEGRDATTTRTLTTLPSGAQLDPTFIKELHQLAPIHAHTYTNADHHNLPLSGRPASRTQRAENAHAALHSLGASAQAIAAASHCAHHAIFEHALEFWPADDMQLSGTTKPVFTNAITHFHFSAAQDGGLYLRVEYGAYAYRPSEASTRLPATPSALNDFPDLSYFHLCSKLLFTSQGVAKIDIPLKITVNVVEA